MSLPPPSGYHYLDRKRILNSDKSQKHIDFITNNLLLNEKLTNDEIHNLEKQIKQHHEHQLIGLHNSPGGSRRRANKHSKKSRKSRKSRKTKSRRH